MNKEQKVRQRLSEFKPMENRGYSIYEVGNLGGNDKERNKIYFVSFVHAYKWQKLEKYQYY